MKQIRHWSLILILNCPSRSPFSFSSLLAGGTFKSLIVFELLIILSFLNAVCWISRGSLFDPTRLYIFSVSLSLNDFITYPPVKYYTGLRLTSSVILFNSLLIANPQSVGRQAVKRGDPGSTRGEHHRLRRRDQPEVEGLGTFPAASVTRS